MVKTIIINLIAGPGAGKTTIAAYLFYSMKIRGLSVEYVQEIAKTLVWKEEFEILNNQHYVSTEQYKLFKSLDGKVKYIITDGSLLHGLYYNRFNSENTSNVDKTELAIHKYFNEFDNINILISRGDFEYETVGRYQSESEARQIDVELKQLLDQQGVAYYTFGGNDSYENILTHILRYTPNSKVNP